MWYKSFIHLSVLAGCLICGGCTSETVVESQETKSISFSSSASATRAAVTKFKKGDTFSVWGGYDSSNNLFSDKPVTYNGTIWTYEGGIQYWVPGKTFNFYAIYPSGIQNASCSDEGLIEISYFDTSKTGAEAVDLMTAKQEGIDGTNPPPSVSLTFNHLLSRVLITAKVVGGSATVHSVSFSGLKTKGSYTSGGPASGWTLEDNPYTFQKTEEIPLKLEETSLFGDMLLLPQEIVVSGENSFKMKVSYTVDGERLEKEIHFSNETVSSWEAGKSYKYTLTIKGNNIGFGVNVIPWNHSTGGIITVE